MNTGKYNRSINLICLTCGGDQFEFDGSKEIFNSAKCAACDREYTKNELIEVNSENISEHVNEIGGKITKDFAIKMQNSLEKAFRGNKNIRIK